MTFFLAKELDVVEDLECFQKKIRKGCLNFLKSFKAVMQTLEMVSTPQSVGFLIFACSIRVFA